MKKNSVFYTNTYTEQANSLGEMLEGMVYYTERVKGIYL